MSDAEITELINAAYRVAEYPSVAAYRSGAYAKKVGGPSLRRLMAALEPFLTDKATAELAQRVAALDKADADLAEHLAQTEADLAERARWLEDNRHPFEPGSGGLRQAITCQAEGCTRSQATASTERPTATSSRRPRHDWPPARPARGHGWGLGAQRPGPPGEVRRRRLQGRAGPRRGLRLRDGRHRPPGLARATVRRCECGHLERDHEPSIVVEDEIHLWSPCAKCPADNPCSDFLDPAEWAAAGTEIPS